MAKFNESVLTNQGRALITDLIGNKGKSKFTKAVTSDKVYSPDSLQGLTSIDQVKQTKLVSSVTVVDPSRVDVEIPIDNTDVTTDYYVQTVGLYCTDTNGKEVLYSVATAQVADLLPAFDGKSSAGLDLTLTINVGNVANVNLVADPAAALGQADKVYLLDQIRQAQLPAVVGGTYALNLGSLSSDDFPSFRAYLYQYGAGIPQPDPGFFGVKQTNQVTVQPQFTNDNSSVQFLINNVQIAQYLPDFDNTQITTSYSSDKRWLYLTSGVSTVGIRADNVAFK